MKVTASVLISFCLQLVLSCPENELGIIRWSDTRNAWGNSPPSTNANVTIRSTVLLDQQPPTLWSITIKGGGKLIWDPNTYVHLKVHWIRVDGELHIGSMDCPFKGRTRITFLGNVKENDLGDGGDKALFVTAGGTLEVHGEPKLSWTKLTKTANKMTSDHTLHANLTDDSGKSGLFVYNIDHATGKLEDSKFFNFFANARKLPDVVEQFVKYLNNIPADNIVGVAAKKLVAPKGPIDDALDAIETLAGQDIGDGPLRDLKEGAAYSLVTVKGSPEKSVEKYVPWLDGGKTSIASTTAEIGDFVVELYSFSNKNNKKRDNIVRIVVADKDDVIFRPVLTLLDDTTTWNEGDKIIIASTDYDWKQAEEWPLIACPSSLCGPNQVRLAGPLRYTHYGEIYQNVDMRGEVGLLSRNILFDSEDAEGSTTYGGNLKFLKGFKSIHIEHAEFNDLGQQEVLGRYPIHFHMCADVDLDEETRPWIKHNSIHHSNSRCVTVHGTHGLIVEDNVCYLTHGHGYFLEDGGEKRTVFDGNLGLGQEKGTLIKADSKPSTFWITNPISYVRNNAAAGGDGRGYWYTYPRIPLKPSDTEGFMMKDEARHTAVYQFDNNVAHSYNNHGIFVDNEFLNDTSATGYNRYRPVEDPIMHLKYGNSSDKPAIFYRLTAYKNSPRNGWFRGGELKLLYSSFSDSLVSVNIVKENSAVQYLENSVIIGDSPNVGEVAIVNKQPVSIGRSFPKFVRSSEMFKYRNGFRYEKGPVHLRNIYFDNFVDNPYYSMGAIGFRKQHSHSPVHDIANAKFGFADPSQGNRIVVKPEDEDEQTEDDVRSFRDVTRSVSGLDTKNPVTLISPEPFHMTEYCTFRQKWNFAYCEHNFGQIKVGYEGNNNNELTVTRDDDYQNARINIDPDKGANFLAVIGGGFSYSMFWADEVPTKISITGEAVTRSEGVRLGICLPPEAEFSMGGRSPSKIQWNAVPSIADVDTTGKYFYDSKTGYLSVFLQHDNDFSGYAVKDCPGEFCTKISVDVSKGDRKDTDCLDNVHAGNLFPKVTPARKMIARLLEILSQRKDRKRRSVTVEELLATGPVPFGWGAGPTRDAASRR